MGGKERGTCPSVPFLLSELHLGAPLPTVCRRPGRAQHSLFTFSWKPSWTGITVLIFLSTPPSLLPFPPSFLPFIFFLPFY